LAQTVVLTGRVLDADTQQPLAGASISVPKLQAGAYTDAQGSYRLDLPAAESGQSVTVQMTFSGYQTQKQSVRLAVGDNVLNWQARPTEFTAEDVVITASKGLEQSQADVTVSIEVVKPQFVELQAQPTVDKVLTQIPGVDNQDGQITIRGSSGYAYGVGSRVMITLDGLPLLTGDAGLASLDLIPVDNIQQIEVMKGASSVLYGSSALGGVINVITAEPGPVPKTTLRLRGGFYGRPANPALDWNGNATTLYGSGHLFHSRRLGPVSLTFQGNYIKDQGYRQYTDREEYRGLVMLTYRPASLPGLTLGLNTSLSIDSSANTLYWSSYSPDTVQANGSTFVEGGGLVPTRDAGAYRRQLANYLALDPVIKYLTASGDLFWYRGRMLRNSNQNNTGQSTTNYILYNDFLYQTTLWDRINWVSGATYTYGEIRGDSLYGGSYVFNGDTIESSGSHRSNSIGIYSQLDGRFGRLNTSLGVRYESVQIDGAAREALPVFRLGANYEITRGTNVRASFGQAFRVPSIAERFANTSGGGVIVEPNPSLLSEKGFSAELGLRQGFLMDRPTVKLKGFVDLAFFRMQYRDMVEFGINGVRIVSLSPQVFEARFSSINVADARITGLEFNQNFLLQIGQFNASLNGGITILDPLNLNAAPADSQLDLRNPANLGQAFNPSAFQDRPEFLKYRSRYTIRYSLSLGHDPVTLTTNLRYRSAAQSIDQYLYLVVPELRDFQNRYTYEEPYWDYLFEPTEPGVSRQERFQAQRAAAQAGPRGDLVFDFILTCKLTPQMTVSVNLDNAFNHEYLVIPGTLAPQRQLTLQYVWTF
jgi:iron complex outermembrane receptor protein